MSGTLTRFSTIARMENELIKGNIYPSSESRINAIYPSRKYRGEYLSYTDRKLQTLLRGVGT